MNQTQFQNYLRTRRVLVQSINVNDLGRTPRTLVYGYNVNSGGNMHVYVQGGLIHRLITDWNDRVINHEWSPSFLATDLRPSKRAYPDCTDEKFAHQMAQADAELCFLGNYNWETSSFASLADDPFKAPTHVDLGIDTHLNAG